jgi:hypothetical protein
MAYRIPKEDATILGTENGIVLLGTPGPIAHNDGSAALVMGRPGSGINGANGDFYCKCPSWRNDNGNPYGGTVNATQRAGMLKLLNAEPIQVKRVCKHMGSYVMAHGMPVLATPEQAAAFVARDPEAEAKPEEGRGVETAGTEEKRGRGRPARSSKENEYIAALLKAGKSKAEAGLAMEYLKILGLL